VADPAVQRLAVLVHAGAVGVAVGSTAVDDGRAAEAGPLLPGDEGCPVAGWLIGVAMATISAAARGQSEQEKSQEKECWQPQSGRGAGTRKARLPAHMNIDEGAVDEAHTSLAVSKLTVCSY